MDSPKRVLIVEDDMHIAELLRLHLRDEGYEVTHAADGDAGLRLLQEGGWDALVLDLMLPGVDGLELCKRTRAMTRYTPIIITSARSSEVHRILGLELGADDYLAKPFSMLELVARVKALVRRTDALARDMQLENGRLEILGLTIDPLAREAAVEGRPLELTPREFDLLAFFARHPGKVFSRMDLLNQVWGYQHDGYEHTVNTHINRLRMKVENDPANPRRILTVWGRGYKFGAPSSQAGEDLMRLTLSQRLSAVFALMLLACCGASLWLQMRATAQYEQETVQRLSMGLASHISESAEFMTRDGLNPNAVHELFDKLMAVNPSVEVYLLNPGGKVVANAAPEGRLKRDHVDTEPLNRLISGAPLPILGDDPRSLSGSKVFSAAPLYRDGKAAGYVYVVLLGEAHDLLSAHLSASATWRVTMWSMALVALLGLTAGLIAFRLITRPLRGLTEAVRRFDAGAPETFDFQTGGRPIADNERDEIRVLEHAYSQMGRRITEQWRELTLADQQRRELIANISHDLRTPLTSLHGYLETLLLKADTLSVPDRRRYLDIALAQSRKVGKLAQALFELARLESGIVHPEKETFSVAELVQDVLQKFELAAEARSLSLTTNVTRDLPPASADLGMIERVLTNLLDNAIRHTPTGGNIEVALRREGGAIAVTVSDSGPGIAPAQRAALFKRPSSLAPDAGGRGGLGLLIVKRMLQLHDSNIRLIDREGRGAVFEFALPAAAT